MSALGSSDVAVLALAAVAAVSAGVVYNSLLFYGTLGAWSSGRSAVPRSCGPAVHAGGAASGVASVEGVELARELGGGQRGRAGGARGVAANGGKPNVLERVSGLVELMLRQIKNTASDDFLGRLRDLAQDVGGLMIRPEDGARGEFGEDALGALGWAAAQEGSSPPRSSSAGGCPSGPHCGVRRWQQRRRRLRRSLSQDHHSIENRMGLRNLRPIFCWSR